MSNVAPPAGLRAAAPDREDALDRLTSAPVDVLVIGGGITGAGIALDAITRGYTVGLVERDDIASGTSSKSSKLVHGGVRYLEQGDIGLVREAVKERDRLRHAAPHLVRPLGFVFPLPDVKTRGMLKAGLSLYDGLAVGRNVRTHRYLSTAQVDAAAPGLGASAPHGGYRYYDCQTDDARLTLAIVQQARRRGALVVNHAEVADVRVADGRVTGVDITDRLTGRAASIDARWVVSATGVWADRVRDLATAHTGASIVPSRGVHLSFSRRDVPVTQATLVPSHAGDGRMVFLIPWGEQVYAGTTDDIYDGNVDAPTLDPDGAGYLLHAINETFSMALTFDDAQGAWAGLRPLLEGDGSSRDLSRRHAVSEGPSGLVTITGGKLTTYRKMAEDLVDHLTAGDGCSAPCVTATIDLGAVGPAEDALPRVERALRDADLDPDLAGALYHRHGDRAPEVLALCVEHGEAERLVPTLPYLAGEVRWAVRHELARTLDDVLQRRLRVSLRDRAAGGAGIARAADIAADELGWPDDHRQLHIDAYRTLVTRERALFPIA